ncbi:MAG: 6-phosphogluconolactonase [Actinobacteria bacterium]|nr:6-phosphogluconolactonase [Actinomycetota bacterium]
MEDSYTVNAEATGKGMQRLKPPKITAVSDVPDAFVSVIYDAFVNRCNDRFTLVLSGGPTARACYERVADGSVAIAWELVDIYMGDERWVSPGSPDANEQLVREALIDRVESVGSFHPMLTDPDRAACIDAYTKEISELLATGGIDVIHLGMGEDGHTASLFPGSAQLNARDDELVVASRDETGTNPHERLSLTLPVINSSRLAVFTVAGSTKAAAMRAVLNGEDTPANRVHAGDVRWLVDAEALGQELGEVGRQSSGEETR